ncbi:MAG TPA: rhombosortase [Gammaproteobacteria bacterium]|nr:rhombosortase [Gammaproteobacteria bacterium]
MTKTAYSHGKFHYRFHSSHLLWLLLFVLSFSLQSLDQVNTWRFDREEVAQGSYWLLLSGHIVHLNWSHWVLNMAGLAIVAFFFSNHASFWQWLTVILVSATTINIGLWWWMPQIHNYVGLSGVLHGLFLYGALREIRFYPLSGYVLTAVLLGKLGWEFFNGALPGSEDMAGGHVLTEAHLLGAIGGILVWLVESGYGCFAAKDAKSAKKREET